MVATKHTIVALVQDKPGVLNRMASLFRRRGYNIESIAVGHSEQPNMSRMTIVTSGSAHVLEQVRKQLDKLVDVIKVQDLSGDRITARELALIKVRASSATRSEIISIVDIFRANIVDVAADSLTIEITGDEDKFDALFNLLRGFGIREIARTGRIAMVRGGGSLSIAANINAIPPAIGATLGASWGFMLPVSTPPNAIVYGSGMIPITKMIRAGIFFDIAGAILLWAGLRVILPMIGLA